jgi:hypothetical protein
MLWLEAVGAYKVRKAACIYKAGRSQVNFYRHRRQVGQATRQATLAMFTANQALVLDMAQLSTGTESM